MEFVSVIEKKIVFFWLFRFQIFSPSYIFGVIPHILNLVDDIYCMLHNVSPLFIPDYKIILEFLWCF